ncbi:MAG: GDSL-type esterase/lipase family protein [Sporichthyaceae bacterium]
MRKQIAAAVLGALGLLQAGAVAHAAPAAPGAGTVALPTTMAALGDSITRGFNACGFYRDCPDRSWSTGTERKDGVAGHRDRLLAAGAPLSSVNLARSGARVAELPGQARAAVAASSDYVTILIGANDVCRPDEARMTAPADFRSGVDNALAVLAARGTRIFIASVPDLKRLWDVGHRHRVVRYVWSKFDVCPTMLANPGSYDEPDVARRDRVRERIRAYNTELAAACVAYGPLCRFDDNAVFRTRFAFDQISKWDFFHPNRGGQRLLAEVTWQQGQFAGAE